MKKPRQLFNYQPFSQNKRKIFRNQRKQPSRKKHLNLYRRN